MKRPYLYPALVSGASLLFAGALVASSGKDVHMEWFKKSDAAVEIEDVRESERRRLKRLDEDGDGSISRDEFASGSPFWRPRHGFHLAGFGVAAIEEAAGTMESQRGVGRVSMMPRSERRIVIRERDGEHADIDEADEVDIDFDLGLAWDGMHFGMTPWPNIDRSEWFNIVDANEDGVLDRDEVSAARGRLRDHGIQQRFDMLDANKDGELNDEDIDARLEKLRALDEDGDGSVSPRELSEVLRLLGHNRMLDQTRAMRLR